MRSNSDIGFMAKKTLAVFVSLCGVQLHTGKRLFGKNVGHYFRKSLRQEGSRKCIITKESSPAVVYSALVSLRLCFYVS